MRTENRNFDELRKIEIIPDFNPYAEGSCLIKCGQTHVICTATVEEKVPAWLKRRREGMDNGRIFPPAQSNQNKSKP